MFAEFPLHPHFHWTQRTTNDAPARGALYARIMRVLSRDVDMERARPPW